MYSSVMRRSLIRSPMQGARLASSLVTKFEESVSRLPMREAVRYAKNNMKWTAADIKMYVDSHANALIEHRFQSGDSIAVWLPESAEKHVTLLAAAKLGLIVYDIDIAISNVADTRKFLTESKCKAIIFEPVGESQDYLKLLRKSIPEFFDYDDTHGQFFHSKYHPNLKFFVQTGQDIERGCISYKSLTLRNPSVSNIDAASAKTVDSLPYYCKIEQGKNGIEISAVKTHGDCLESGFESLSFLKKLINHQHFEQVSLI